MAKTDLTQDPDDSEDDEKSPLTQSKTRKLTDKALRDALSKLNKLPLRPPWTKQQLELLAGWELVAIKRKDCRATDRQKDKAAELLRAKKAERLKTHLAKMRKAVADFQKGTPVDAAKGGYIGKYVYVMTWNMNGSSQKWHTHVAQFKEYDFVCLQECGLFPASMKRVEIPGWVGHNTQDIEYAVFGRWKDWNVFWVHTGGASSKVESAILTPHKPTAVALVRTTHLGSRLAVGLEIGGEVICYSFHAWSNGGIGNDAEAMVAAVSWENTSRNHDKWLLAGDFNREPNSINQNKLAGITHTCVLTDTETRPASGRYYDYVVAGWEPDIKPRSEVIDVGAYSDHNPALFEIGLTPKVKTSKARDMIDEKMDSKKNGKKSGFDIE